MAELTKKADVSGLAGTYDAIVGAVAFPDGEVFRQLQLLHEHELLSDLSDDDLSIHLLPEPVLPSVPEHDLPILPEPVL